MPPLSLALHRRAGWHGYRLHQDRSGWTRKRLTTFHPNAMEGASMTKTPNTRPTRQTLSSEAWRAMGQTPPTTALNGLVGQALVTSINRQAQRLAAARAKLK